MTFSTIIAVFTIFCLTLCLYHFQNSKRRRSRLPPSPPALPIIGNLLDMPLESEWVKFKQMGEKYKSDLIYLDVLGTCIIIANSWDAVNELLEKRSSIYSSRTRLPMVNELMGWSWAFSHMAYGEPWRARRRLFHQELNLNAARRFYPQQIKACHGLLRNLLQSPKNWEEHFRHQTAAVIMDIAYGIKILPQNDPYVDAAEKAMASANAAATPGKYLVDFVPILKYVPSWVPGAGFQKVAQEGMRLSQAMRSVPYKALKIALANGLAKPSFGSYCLQNLDTELDNSVQEEIICDTAGMMYTAGAETTTSYLATFLMAMIKFPEAQAKAQLELDTVLGKNQLPSYEDEDILPYLAATIKETLRWQQVTPTAVPHCLMQDDEYKGYSFPSGTIVIPNAWAILHDEKIYPDPYEFKPERYLKDGKLDPSIPDPSFATFGFGRRICPGQHVARGTLWITAGSVLAMFNMEKAVDKNGVIIEPSTKFTSGITSHPEKFECKITPRSKDAEKLTRATQIE